MLRWPRFPPVALPADRQALVHHGLPVPHVCPPSILRMSQLVWQQAGMRVDNHGSERACMPCVLVRACGGAWPCQKRIAHLWPERLVDARAPFGVPTDMCAIMGSHTFGPSRWNPSAVRSYVALCFVLGTTWRQAADWLLTAAQPAQDLGRSITWIKRLTGLATLMPKGALRSIAKGKHVSRWGVDLRRMDCIDKVLRQTIDVHVQLNYLHQLADISSWEGCTWSQVSFVSPHLCDLQPAGL